MTRYIGDVHGHRNYNRYKTIIKDCENSVQVGDMGVGFFKLDLWSGERTAVANPPYDVMVAGNHRFIRGNHDNPEVCRRHSQWIPDGAIENGIMYIGGGLSIDRAYRTEGFSWWKDEELSYDEFSQLLDKYNIVRPHTMVTHDCPESVADAVMGAANKTKLNDPSRTRQAFQAMLELHRPKVWVHGHWHVSFDQVINGTRFVCLNELEFKDIEEEA